MAGYYWSCGSYSIRNSKLGSAYDRPSRKRALERRGPDRCVEPAREHREFLGSHRLRRDGQEEPTSVEARDVQRVLDEREPRPHVDVDGELVEADEHDVRPGMDRRVVGNRATAFRVERLRSDGRRPGLRMVGDPHDVESISIADAGLRGMLRREEEAPSRPDEGQRHRRILRVDRHEDMVRGPGLRRIRGLLDVHESVDGAAEHGDLVRRKGPLTGRDNPGAVRGARLVHDALEEAPNRIEARDGRQVVEVVEQDGGTGILPEELDDGVDELEVEAVRPHRPLRAGRGGDPQDRRALETEPGRDMRRRKARDAQAGWRRG